jgi:hypothetical protein
MRSTHFNGFSLLALKLISRRANAEDDQFFGLPEIRQSNYWDLGVQQDRDDRLSSCMYTAAFLRGI